ncbi:uncharacterized protein LOC141647223 [Silene latifolia]|uniref:uncharacterized protein LOC141647223 n=1 Tax=Silene latifolia TaxID=37657 RepID=UPI003D7825B3
MAVGDCSRLIEKVVERIRGWGARKLSYAGRLVLINDVLTQLHSFWARIFIIPLTVIDKITSICRNYLWASSDKYGRVPAVAWDQVCLGKKYGGTVHCGQWIYLVAGGLVKVDWWPLIWNRLSLPKYAFIGWLMIQERLYTKDRMLRFGVISDGLCDICRTQMEDHQHLFYSCDFSTRCWTLLREWLGVPLPTNDVLHWCSMWRCRSLLKKQLVYAAVVALIYHIWMAQNVCREEHRVPIPRQIFNEIRRYIQNLYRSKEMMSRFSLVL